MARFFPRVPRRRVTAALAASSLLLSFAAVPLASADDLRDRKDRVTGDINETLSDLDQSSAQLVAANNALMVARSRLAAAEQHLAKTRG